MAIIITTFMIATVLTLCINQIQKQNLYMAENIANRTSEIDSLVYVLILVGVLVVIAGILFIYNVMSISVTKEVRFWGSIMAIGASKKQIVKISVWQMMMLCIIGIPIGIIFSIIISYLIVPMFLSMYTDIYSKGDAIILYPIVFLMSALICSHKKQLRVLMVIFI